MTLLILSSAPKHTEHPRFITVYKPIAGWKVVQYWWNPEHGGFWEPWQTADWAFATEEEAIEDGTFWAEAEDLPFWYAGYTPEKHEQIRGNRS